MSDVAVELSGMLAEARWVGQGWHVNRSGASWSCVRDGFARVVITWLGGERWMIAWEYEGRDWRVEIVDADMITMETDMTLNAMWR